MTPAISLLKKAKIEHKIHEYSHDTKYESYGLEAAEKLSVQPEKVFKTLVVELDTGHLVVAILPVCKMLSLKLLAKIALAKKAQMAEKAKVQRSTGFVLGGVSPLGQKKHLTTFLDKSAVQHNTIFISAGKRGLEIELAPNSLIKLTSAKLVEIAV